MWGPRGAILLPGDTAFITPLLGRRGSPGGGALREAAPRSPGGSSSSRRAARECVTPAQKGQRARQSALILPCDFSPFSLLPEIAAARKFYPTQAFKCNPSGAATSTMHFLPARGGEALTAARPGGERQLRLHTGLGWLHPAPPGSPEGLLGPPGAVRLTPAAGEQVFGRLEARRGERSCRRPPGSLGARGRNILKRCLGAASPR